MLFSAEIFFAQYYKTTQYADHNGLPSRIVRDVAQDSKGYLWVAGNNGLFKFDGQKFWPFYASLKDTTGLRDNKINSVCVDHKDRVWIATPKGLHRMENEIIRHIPLDDNPTAQSQYISSIYEDSSQNVWVGGYGGLYKIDPEGTIHNLTTRHPELFEKSTVWGISEDDKGRIWVCRASGGPLLANPANLELIEVEIQLSEEIDAEDFNPLKFYQHSEELFLINSGNGLLKGHFDGISNLEVHPFKDPDGNSIAKEYVYNSIVDSQGFIWTVTWQNLFKKYSLNENLELEEQEVISKNGLLGMSGYSNSVMEDSQSNIWITNANGLFKLTEDHSKLDVFPPSQFPDCVPGYRSTYTMAEDAGGNLWVTTPRSLYRFKKADIIEKRCPEQYLFLEDKRFKTCRNLYIDSSNRLWMGAEGGIGIAQLDRNFNPGEFFFFTAENGLPHNWSYAIVEQDKNTFWVGNYHRLLKVQLNETDLSKTQIFSFDVDPNRDDALVNSFVVDLEKDADGNLWVGTFSGLSKMISEENGGIFKNYVNEFGNQNKLSNNSIKKIFKDSKGRMWIGTQTGLNLYRSETDDFLQFGRDEGLPSEYVLGIDEDSEGQLWVATTQGLFKAVFNESMQSFVHIDYYTVREGLADNITNRNAVYIDGEDNVFAGSSMGLSYYTSNGAARESKPFNLALTSFESIHEKEQGFNSVKERIENGELKLSYRENSIQLNYAALDFTDPSFNRYRHKILPVRDDWIETGSTSQLNYYNLTPGTYDLILDGSNNQGVWSDAPIAIKLIVTPPFWKSGIAFVLYAVIFGGLLRYFYLVRVRKRERQLAMETKLERALVQEREELRKENTADFHDELGSKVTKISLFLTLAERSLRENKDPSQWFAKMRSNIKDLSGSFRDLLWVIDPQKDSLGDAFLRLKDFGEDLFNNTEVDFRTSGYETSYMDLLLDPQTKKQIVMIFKEAMNNCAKYSEGDRVELKLISEEHQSQFILTDNGKGFNVQNKSKGRGLTNMMNRAKKIGAEIIITSSEKGTRISLEGIPHSRDDFHREAM